MLAITCTYSAMELNKRKKGGKELTLHLPNHQLLIQPIRPRQNEQLATAGFEEFPTQSDEPVFPEWFRGGEVCSPDPWSCWIGGV